MAERKTKARGASRVKKPGRPSTASRSSSNAGAASIRAAGKSASRLIDQRIRELGDWRGETLARMRALILAADPAITEEWKWMGTPVWSHAGNICTGETYQQVVKLTFARGAALEDPRGLFNSSLTGNTRRAIDIREGEVVDPEAFKRLIRAAVAKNLRSTAPRARSTSKPGVRARSPKLLSGGNPQIAKADGDAPVQAYIAAMPGWKSDVGKRIDALIVHSVPDVRKAVKWNSPFYGVAEHGWFLSFHVFTRYVKVTFFNGRLLRPMPPGGTPKSNDARWIDIHEGDDFDADCLKSWILQAAALPGWLQ